MAFIEYMYIQLVYLVTSQTEVQEQMNVPL